EHRLPAFFQLFPCFSNQFLHAFILTFRREEIKRFGCCTIQQKHLASGAFLFYNKDKQTGPGRSARVTGQRSVT
ncbi:MAG: hypothetical protein IKG76_06535, partial [Firmicutes bacterium]|nr:hypothetical protein [Bacillota bacterium]